MLTSHASLSCRPAIVAEDLDSRGPPHRAGLKQPGCAHRSRSPVLRVPPGSGMTIGDRYHAAFRQSLEDPDAFWGEAARAVDWITAAAAGARRRPPAVLPLVPRRLAQHLLQRPRPARRAGRGDQAALIYDSPVTGTVQTSRMPSCSTRSPRSPGRCAALGVGKGDRVVIYMPMVPEAVVAMLACARHRRHPLGRLRRLRAGRARGPHRRRQAKVVIVGLLRHRADAGRRRTSRMLDAALDRCRAQARALRHPAARSRCRGDVGDRDIDWDWAALAAAPSRPTASRSPRPTRSTSSTPPARPAGPRASCATTAATRSRCAGRWRTSTASARANVFLTASDVGWVVGHSYIVYAPLLTGATTVLYEGKPVGTPDAGAFWRVIADHGVDGAVHRADRLPRDQAEDPTAR